MHLATSPSSAVPDICHLGIFDAFISREVEGGKKETHLPCSRKCTDNKQSLLLQFLLAGLKKSAAAICRKRSPKAGQNSCPQGRAVNGGWYTLLSIELLLESWNSQSRLLSNRVYTVSRRALGSEWRRSLAQLQAPLRRALRLERHRWTKRRRRQ